MNPYLNKLRIELKKKLDGFVPTHNLEIAMKTIDKVFDNHSVIFQSNTKLYAEMKESFKKKDNEISDLYSRLYKLEEKLNSLKPPKEM